MYNICFPVTINLGATALTRGFTNGVGQIWLDDVQCVGNESRLIDCRTSPVGVHACFHIEDAGVSCPPISTNDYYISPYSGLTQNNVVPCSTQGAIRLQGGNATSGRLEVCNDGAWGTVCDDFWDITDVRVACNQLGLPSLSKSLANMSFKKRMTLCYTYTCDKSTYYSYPIDPSPSQPSIIISLPAGPHTALYIAIASSAEIVEWYNRYNTASLGESAQLNAHCGVRCALIESVEYCGGSRGVSKVSIETPF